MSLTNRRFQVRFTRDPGDIKAAQQLRQRAFFASDQALDHDAFDEICTHVLLEERDSGRLACCFRLLTLTSGAQIEQSYSAQFYDLKALHGFEGAIVEVGRFCLDPEGNDSEVVRAAWAELTRYVDENNIKMLFGCSSFQGTDPAPYAQAFGALQQRHLAPEAWAVGVKAPDVVRYGLHPVEQPLMEKPDQRAAMAQMPPLLRSYLQMGGWVSDHAVIDHKMNTLHVFTGLEIAAIPAARKRILRALAR